MRPWRPRALALVFLLLAGATAALPWQPGVDEEVRAGSPGGWAGEVVYANIPRPMDFAFAPDGRIFIATLTGQVRIIKNGSLLGTAFHTVPANPRGERGLLGLALDPSFAANGYVYLFYTHENDASNPQGPKTGRLVRVTANGDVSQPGSEVVLLGTTVGDASQPTCGDFPIGTDCLPEDGLSHTGGGLRFAADGSLLVATGDGSYAAPNEQELMTHVQDLDRLSGKMLRIDPATGQGLADNPFYTGDPAANRSKVYAYGLRQPFRFSVRPGTSTPFVGEVGSSQWEEINVVTPGGNYGWPCFEGYAQHPYQNVLPFCQAFYASQPTVEHPIHVYERVPPYGAAVIGGVFADGSNYPPDASGAYFFADYIRDEIYALGIDGSNNPVDGSLQTVLANAGYPVDFEVGADGDVYYLTWDRVAGSLGELRHLAFVEGNRSPVAKASASPQGGLAPLVVDFSSVGSDDPDGDVVAYDWDFDDGGSSNEAEPSHTFMQNGTYNVTLTVSDGNGGVDVDGVTVIVGNQPPVATIAAPYPLTTYEPWDVISFSGTGVDPETGALGAPALQWSVGLRHCEALPGGVCHTHPFLEKTGVSGTLVAPDQGAELHFLVIELTVTDGAGLADTAEVTIGADTDGDGLLDFEEALTIGTDRFDPDTDGGGAPDGVDYAIGDPFDPGDDTAVLEGDADGDGCANGGEAGPNAELGGQRDVLNPWDFFDVWTPVLGNPGWERNHSIDLLGDIFGVALRFGTSRGSPPSEAEAVAEAAVPPADSSSYHAAFDRGVQVGPNAWDAGPPDGSIDLFNDIFRIAVQFGHDCGP